MRVLMLCYDYPPSTSGAAQATAALAEGLAGHGVAVDVVAGGGYAVSESRVVWGEAAEGIVAVHRVPSRRPGNDGSGLQRAAAYVACATPVVRRLLRRQSYDVIHVAFAPPAAAMLPMLDLGGAAVVVSLRGVDVPGAAGPRATRNHSLRVHAARWLWRRADRVVVPSETAGRLAHAIDPKLRYAWVPLGVDVATFRPRSALRRAPDGVIRCLAVARLVPHNGLDDLVDAVALLDRRRFQLEIVGAGPSENGLRARVRRHGLETQVRLTGWLDRPQLIRRYREADLFTLAPQIESLGGSFVEALASGLPIVGSTAGNIPEILGHERHGSVVPPGRPYELAQAIDRLADDPRRRAEISRRNRAEAVEKYAWTRLTTRYLALYQGARRSAPNRSAVTELPAGSW
jgi:glycosyltransferase involved in cell wall biosynthesis